jgi:hypothetical protein
MVYLKGVGWELGEFLVAIPGEAPDMIPCLDPIFNIYWLSSPNEPKMYLYP